MIVAHYRFTRGSQIDVPLDFKADASEQVGELTISAWLRFSGFRPKEVTAEMPISATFTVEVRAENAGWFLSIPAAESAELAIGFHLADVRVTTSDGVERTSDRLALIEIVEPVTGGAI